MRNKKQIAKDRAKNKKARKEKIRLHLRNKKRRKPRYVIIQITGLELSVIEEIRRRAKEKHLSVNKFIGRMLKEYMDVHENYLNEN